MNLQESIERVVLHLDLDCYYAQVHMKMNPDLRGKPVGVRQYQMLIAVSYEAKARGVTRIMNAEAAKKACPDIIFADVPMILDKVCLDIYRQHSKEIFRLLKTFDPNTEKGGLDEAYMDITHLVDKFIVERPHEELHWAGILVGDQRPLSEVDRRLMIGSMIAEEIRHQVREELGFNMSCGVSHNKLLCKIGSAKHKPSGQTIVRVADAASFVSTAKMSKIPGLGGKLGKQVVDAFGCQTGGDLYAISFGQLVGKFGEETGNYLYRLARGVDDRPVAAKGPPKSILSCKSFTKTSDLAVLRKWLLACATDIEKRVETDNDDFGRLPKNLILRYNKFDAGYDDFVETGVFPPSRQAEAICDAAVNLFKRSMMARGETFFTVGRVSLATNRFTEPRAANGIESFFRVADSSTSPVRRGTGSLSSGRMGSSTVSGAISAAADDIEDDHQWRDEDAEMDYGDDAWEDSNDGYTGRRALTQATTSAAAAAPTQADHPRGAAVKRTFETMQHQEWEGEGADDEEELLEDEEPAAKRRSFEPSRPVVKTERITQPSAPPPSQAIKPAVKEVKPRRAPEPAGAPGSYSGEALDPAVFASLPLSLQAELRMTLPPDQLAQLGVKIEAKPKPKAANNLLSHFQRK